MSLVEGKRVANIRVRREKNTAYYKRLRKRRAMVLSVGKWSSA